jgi:RIO kinase 2
LSTVRQVAELAQQLNEVDFKVLSFLASKLPQRRHVPFDVFERETGLSRKKLEFSLSKLQALKLVRKEPQGYRLVYAGLDALALHRLRSMGALDAIGLPIAVGKESDVYEGVSGGSFVAVKVYRIGRISFRSIKRERGYVPGELHEWLLASVRSASREYANLKRLAGYNLPVPSPIARSLHVIVMSEVKGVLLRVIRKLRDPEDLLCKILGAVRRVYLEARMVNADLSEYNVLVDVDEDGTWGEYYLIDWPQAVKANSANAKDLLLRDVTNLVRFFRRRFKTSIPVEAAYRYVLGESDAPC